MVRVDERRRHKRQPEVACNVHGRIADEPDIVKYRDMTVLFRDRILNMIRKGMTLDQVKAAKPFWDYEALYHSESGLGSADFVIEAIYKDLSRNNSKK